MLIRGIGHHRWVGHRNQPCADARNKRVDLHRPQRGIAERVVNPKQHRTLQHQPVPDQQQKADNDDILFFGQLLQPRRDRDAEQNPDQVRIADKLDLFALHQPYENESVVVQAGIHTDRDENCHGRHEQEAEGRVAEDFLQFLRQPAEHRSGHLIGLWQRGSIAPYAQAAQRHADEQQHRNRPAKSGVSIRPLQAAVGKKHRIADRGHRNAG